MSRIRVGVVGVGRWGRNHVRVLKELEKEGLVEMYAICDVDVARARSVANEFDVPVVVENVLDLAKHVEAAVVAVPIENLCNVARTLIAEGVHVLVEKPVATCVQEIEELISLSKSRGVFVMPGYIMRFNPVAEKLREVYSKSKIFYVVSRRLSRRPPHMRRYSILLDLAVHDVDLCMYITDSNRLSVKSGFVKHVQEDAIVIAVLEADNSLCHIHVDGLSLAKVREIELIGEEMFVRGDTDSLTVYIKRGDGSYVIEKLVGEEPLKKEDRTFIRIVQTGEVPEHVPTLESAREVLKVVEKLQLISRQYDIPEFST